MSRDKELGVWGFEHMVLYLRAMVLRATPQPHHTVVRVLALVDQIVATMTPRDLNKEVTQSPATVGAGRFARETTNMICAIVSNWAGFTKGPGGIWRGEQPHETCYGVEVTRDKRDAAIAAMTAGSFSTACEILMRPD